MTARKRPAAKLPGPKLRKELSLARKSNETYRAAKKAKKKAPKLPSYGGRKPFK